MKKIPFVVKIICAVIAIIIPFASIPTLAIITEPQYQDSFVGALDEKTERLYSIEGEKIVIVGGSSVAFGYDSSIIEKYTGMPVVNFGLYAALGTKLMLDLSRDAIGEGDIVIIAPELDAQTLSLYFSSQTTLRAFDGAPWMYKYIPGEHWISLLGGSWDFLSEKLKYIKIGAPEHTGVYNSNNFNEYGDISKEKFERAENVMPMYYDMNTMVNLSPEILDPEFTEYLNEYIKDCEDAGAKVYFEFCPVNELSVVSGIGEAERAAFVDYLKENINCTFIASSIEDYLYEAGYFYDSNFHLNDAGVIKHTVNVTRDLLLELGIPKAVKEEIPEAPALPLADVRYFGEDENAKYFDYEQLPDGSYMITGVKDEYKNLKELTVPLGYNTYKVSSIGPQAFAGTSLETLILTEDTNIRSFMNDSFKGASTLKKLVIYYPTEEDILPPASFAGVPSDFKVYIPMGSNYSAGYFWSERGLTFEFME